MDFSSVKGKVAIVTGASRGIGEAIAKVFGEHGVKVVCAARSQAQGQAVADEICAKGGDAIFVQTDCSDPEAIKRLIDAAVAHYGRLDGVVSNAGIGMGGTPLHEYGLDEYEKIFDLNRCIRRHEVWCGSHIQDPQSGRLSDQCGLHRGSDAAAGTGPVYCHKIRCGRHDPRRRIGLC